MSTKWKEEANYVGIAKARENAAMHALREVVQKSPGMEIWRNARVFGRPLKIYDLNGKTLFWQFPLVRKNQMVGRILTSASKVLGAPVYSMQLGPRKWDLRKATDKAIEQARKIHRRSRIQSTRVVCYSYPKMGISVRFKDTRGRVRRVIVDAADYHVVPEEPPKPDMEGTGMYSLYNSIPMNQRKDLVENWEKSASVLEKARTESAIDITKTFTAQRLQTIDVNTMSTAIISWFKIGSKVVTFCPHTGPHSHPTATGLSIFPYIETPLCFELHGQTDPVWCAVATGQMILDWWRYYSDQNDIATAMGTGASGTYNSGQVNGYESLSNNQLDATYDTNATWTKARDEINENRPLKSGIPGHARACAGWKRWGTEKWLYIYDPWPPDPSGDGGSVYWENWDTVTHTNFIFVRRA
ncbi:MAG: C39 family peptidase [Candidatus Bathyarchaeota archaeon]|nr:MAG: C39 family peptidase [Candidatus Bathyarchaeota archaeon]